MIITTKKTTITLLTSAALSAGLALSPIMVSAETSPFVSAELSGSYMQLAEAAGDVGKSATEHQDSVLEDENGTVESDDMTTEPGAAGNVEDSATKHQKSVTEDEMDTDDSSKMKKDHKTKNGSGMEQNMEEEGDMGIKK